MQPWSFSIQVPKILKNDPPGQVRVRIPVAAVFIFSCFTQLQISTLFYFGVVYFTIEFERKKKKQGGNYGQIFPKIVHQKINSVFEMQYSFSQTLNAIQTNIKESKASKRINLTGHPGARPHYVK